MLKCSSICCLGKIPLTALISDNPLFHSEIFRKDSNDIFLFLFLELCFHTNNNELTRYIVCIFEKKSQDICFLLNVMNHVKIQYYFWLAVTTIFKVLNLNISISSLLFYLPKYFPATSTAGNTACT